MKKLTLLMAGLFLVGATYACEGDKKACCKKGEKKECCAKDGKKCKGKKHAKHEHKAEKSDTKA